MKVLILDSGPLINFSLNSFLYLFEALKEQSGVRLVITPSVKREIVDRPIGIPRFELGALRLRDLISRGVIELPDVFGVKESEINERTHEYLEKANHFVRAQGKWISIVSEAEMSCLALSKILSEKGIENLVAVDERTTRMLCESPKSLEEMIGQRIHKRVSLARTSLSEFKSFKFVRSTELIYVAFKKGLLRIKDPLALEAALYASKYHGSSTTFEELKVLQKL